MIDETGVPVNLSPVAINTVNSSQRTAGATASAQVIFGNLVNSTNAPIAGTITLTNGDSWESLGYTAGQGIYIDAAVGTNNGNGLAFTGGSNYYTIAAISGDTLILQAGATLTASSGSVAVDVAPVTISVVGTVVATLIGVTSPTPAGTGNNIVIGGVGADTIDIGGSNNTILGDDGQASYSGTTGLITSIASRNSGYGGNDIIDVSGGGNAIIGGAGADTIEVGSSNNTILGDDGQASYSATGILMSIGTIFPTDGGNDVIDVAGGDNAILGGYGADTITVGGPNNTILGDNGVATFDPASGDVTEVTSFTGLAGDVPGVGGDDTIAVMAATTSSSAASAPTR